MKIVGQLKQILKIQHLSTDPCPIPICWSLGDYDYYSYGWLSLVTNISDLAAMGVKPSGILLSCIIPLDFTTEELNRFIEGVSAASKKFSCPIIGGNLKEGRDFEVHASIIGENIQDRYLSRNSIQDKDKILIIGDIGHHWFHTFNVLYEENSSSIEILKEPLPQIFQSLEILNSKLINSCIDASDGIIKSITRLARINEMDAIIDEEKLINCLDEEIINLFSIHSKNLLNFILSPGDWHLVCSISTKNYYSFKKLVIEYNKNLSEEENFKKIIFNDIGEFIKTEETPIISINKAGNLKTIEPSVIDEFSIQLNNKNNLHNLIDQINAISLYR